MKEKDRSECLSLLPGQPDVLGVQKLGSVRSVLLPESQCEWSEAQGWRANTMKTLSWSSLR